MALKPISVLITGANRGLGLELAKQIVENQQPLSALFACCRDPDGPKAGGLRTLAEKHPGIINVIRLDSADPNSIKQAAQKVGSLVGNKGLNLIINNAAIAVHSPVHESTPEDMHNCFNTNVVGPMCIMQEFLPHLRAAAKLSGIAGMSCRKAAIVNISTIISSMEKAKEMYTMFSVTPYCVSKAALNMLTVCASVELNKDNILCALLHPGWVRTDMGGPQGEIDAEESVQGMIRVIYSMTEKHNGTLVDYKGETIPW